MSKIKTIVLNSGGLNSAVLAWMAARDGPVALLHAQLGHRASEIEAELFAKQSHVIDASDRLVIDLPHFAAMGGNGRVNRKRAIEDVLALGDCESACYIPGLIGTLLSAAITWAPAINATRIVIGVSEDLSPPGPKTAAVFPDYSRDFIQLFAQATAVAMPYRPIAIEAPLMDLSRVEVVKLGQRVGARFDLTWSCLSSGTEPCGGCIGCATRQRGFLDAALPDPILLETAAR